MQRRQFLKAGLGLAALGAAGFARADAHTTYERVSDAIRFLTDAPIIPVMALCHSLPPSSVRYK